MCLKSSSKREAFSSGPWSVIELPAYCTLKKIWYALIVPVVSVL